MAAPSVAITIKAHELKVESLSQSEKNVLIHSAVLQPVSHKCGVQMMTTHILLEFKSHSSLPVSQDVDSHEPVQNKSSGVTSPKLFMFNLTLL